MSSRKRLRLIPWLMKMSLWLLVLISFMILFVFPPLTNLYLRNVEEIPKSADTVIQTVEAAQHWLLRGFIVVWVFVLGGCFASFLNVVAWRLPQGRRILGSSKCPFCNNKLSFTANLPVFGWLSSGGRCRSCKLPISTRYLWVEIILGLVFVAVITAELFCGGINLPIRPVEEEWGIGETVISPKFDLIQIAAFHLIVLCLLFTMALVRLGGKQVPYSVFAFGLIVGVGFQFLWPAAQQVGWQTRQWGNGIENPNFWLGMLLGGTSGLLCGTVVAFSNRNRSTVRSEYWRECLMGFLLIGLFFGVQFVLSVALALLLIDALLVVIGDIQGNLFRLSPIFKTFAITLILLLAWRFTSEFVLWPGPNSSLQQLGISALAIVALGALTSLIAIPQNLPTDVEEEILDVI